MRPPLDLTLSRPSRSCIWAMLIVCSGSTRTRRRPINGAVRIDPKSADALYWLGAIAATEQNLTLARQYHAKLKTIDESKASKLLEFITPK